MKRIIKALDEYPATVAALRQSSAKAPALWHCTAAHITFAAIVECE
jgi:hypothetical protein